MSLEFKDEQQFNETSSNKIGVTPDFEAPEVVKTHQSFQEKTIQRLDRLILRSRQIKERAAEDARRRIKILQDIQSE